jgi:hypothetical protein
LAQCLAKPLDSGMPSRVDTPHHEDPGADKESNWLPSPVTGTLEVTMRLYAPKPQAWDGRWNPPAIKRVDGVDALL